MRIGIVGGGINGLCCALQLAERGHDVVLFERDALVGATSRSSSKLLHGGLRYLETGQFRLVRESLTERDAWLERAPEHTRELPLLLPIHRHAGRSRWVVGLGLRLYDLLAFGSPLPKARWLDAAAVRERLPVLDDTGLAGAWLYHDGQMDDHALGLRVAEQARVAGADLRPDTPVAVIATDGRIDPVDGASERFDAVINAAGPWTGELLARSGIDSGYRVDPVRGSHLVLDLPCPHGSVLQSADGRIVFVLPWQGGTLVGTTEVRQRLDEPIACSNDERDYLLELYNHFMEPAADTSRIRASFAGVRPLVYRPGNPSRASRDYILEPHGRILSIFGGKWTTAMALARRVARRVDSKYTPARDA